VIGSILLAAQEGVHFCVPLTIRLLQSIQRFSQSTHFACVFRRNKPFGLFHMKDSIEITVEEGGYNVNLVQLKIEV
jgi:hypothetical protein